MKRILQIVPYLDGGGVENLLLNYYTKLGTDNYTFDFIVHTDKIGSQEEIFKSMGSKIFHIPSKKENLVKNLRDMRMIIKNGKYDAIHVHQGAMSFIPIVYAKKSNIEIRITHNHKAYEKKSYIKWIIEKVLAIGIIRCSTHCIACSKDAGVSLWGKSYMKKEKIIILKNGIEINKFIFNEIDRNKIRKELNISDEFVVGCIARLSHQKNHEFLIKIFNEICKKNSESILLLVGTGELEDEINRQIRDTGIEDKVIFLGYKENINKILQGIDVFVLPSRYEGLGISYIEAQAAGLVSFGTKNAVPYEAKVTDLMKFIDLNESPEYWAKEISKYNNSYKRDNTSEQLKLNEYSVEIMIDKIKRIYNG